jgi:maleate isomerase
MAETEPEEAERMYGWRGRIGVILPADNAVLEPDFHRMAPEGVATHVSRLRKAPRPEMPVLALEHAATLVRTRVDVIAYMCAASSFILGPEGNERLCADLGKAAHGLPAFTASTAMTAALSAVGVRRIGVVAPHPADVAEHLRTYLQKSGFDIASFTALGLDLAAINDAAPAEIYRRTRRADFSGCEAIFIAATNFRAIDIIDALEADTGLPVVTSNQAAMWMALRQLGVVAAPTGFGRLLCSGAVD